eukprot:m.142018 g.142018  ORF g.142018 m.142018 type:complete len:237 (-) comp14046_c0_seq2:613-1323(-)
MPWPKHLMTMNMKDLRAYRDVHSLSATQWESLMKQRRAAQIRRSNCKTKRSKAMLERDLQQLCEKRSRLQATTAALKRQLAKEQNRLLSLGIEIHVSTTSTTARCRLTSDTDSARRAKVGTDVAPEEEVMLLGAPLDCVPSSTSVASTVVSGSKADSIRSSAAEDESSTHAVAHTDAGSFLTDKPSASTQMRRSTTMGAIGKSGTLLGDQGGGNTTTLCMQQGTSASKSKLDAPII